VRVIGDYGQIEERCCAVLTALASPSTAAMRAVGGKVSTPGDP
jgi:hypothetical protein